jgi:hypothetical protein
MRSSSNKPAGRPEIDFVSAALFKLEEAISVMEGLRVLVELPSGMAHLHRGHVTTKRGRQNRLKLER